MKRRVLGRVDCPVGRALDEIGDWWSLLIVRDAFDGMRRFGEFQKNLGISKGILAARLKHLVAIGVLTTEPVSEDGAFEEYVLTKKGRDLFLVNLSLRQWGEDHCFSASEPHSVLIEKENGQRVTRLALRGRDGEPLDGSSTVVRKVTGRLGSAKERKPKATRPAKSTVRA